MYIEWTESLSVGVETIDKQHRELFDTVNKFMEAMGQNRGKVSVIETLEFLEKYVVVHFGTEEKYMDRTGYPHSKAHKREHNAFVNEFQDIKDRFLGHNKPTYLTLQVEIGHRLVKWLLDHISENDITLGRYLVSRHIH